MALLILLSVHLWSFASWGVGGYAYDSGQYLLMMSGVYSDLHPPGYSLFLRAVAFVFKSPEAPYFANHMLSFFVCSGLFWLSRLKLGGALSLFVALFYCFFTRTLLWSNWLLSESFYLAILFLQVVVHRRSGWLLDGGFIKVFFLGLLWGFSVFVRSSSLFLLPMVLSPFFYSMVFRFRVNVLDRVVQISFAKLAAFLAGILILVGIVSLDVHSQTGQYSITQAASWNLLYGHPETARCTPDESDEKIKVSFCNSFKKVPIGMREFALAQREGAPGSLLINELGGFREAGPTLQRIMRSQIFEKPGVYLFESLSNGWHLITRSDAWYRPNQKYKNFIRDKKVSSVFEERFGSIPEISKSSKPYWFMEYFYIRPVPILIFWISLLLGCFLYQIRLSYLNLGVPLVILGTSLVAFGEPRYFAPVELLFFCVLSVQLALIKESHLVLN